MPKYPTVRPVGRPRKDQKREDALAVLMQAAPHAADYILKLVTQSRMKTSTIRFDACKFVLEQILGKARFKIELPAGAGGININMLVQLAQQQGLNPPPDPTRPAIEVTSVKHMLPVEGSSDEVTND